MVSGSPLCPIGGSRGITISPIGAGRSLDSISWQPLHDFIRETSDDLSAGPISHAINPNNEAAGGKAAQVVVALDQHHVGAKPRGGNGGRRSGRTTADYQYVGLSEDWSFARRLKDGFGRAVSPHPRITAKQFDTLRRTNAAAVVAAARRIAKMSLCRVVCCPLGAPCSSLFMGSSS